MQYAIYCILEVKKYDICAIFGILLVKYDIILFFMSILLYNNID